MGHITINWHELTWLPAKMLMVITILSVLQSLPNMKFITDLPYGLSGIIGIYLIIWIITPTIEYKENSNENTQ